MQRYTRNQVKEATPKTQKKAASLRKARLIRAAIMVCTVLLLLIPTYFAIGSYIYVKNAPDDQTQTYYTALSIVGPTGTSISLSPNENADIFQCFSDMLKDPNPVSAVKPGNDARYAVTFHTNTGREDYVFHFSHENNSVYFTNAGGAIYHVTNDSGDLFLNSPLSYELYPQAVLPSLQAASTDIILPAEVDWHYRTLDGDFLQLINASTEAEIKTYGIADNFVSFMLKNMQSSMPFVPDDCHLTITREGSEIFSAPIDAKDLSKPLSLPTLTGNELFTIRAEYYQKSDASYYGSLVYCFTMSSTEPAVFDIINRHTVTEGGFYLFAAQNADRMDQLLFSTGLDGAETVLDPVVFRRGSTVYAIIPAESVREHGSLIVKYGSKKETFTLSQTPRLPFDASALVSFSAEAPRLLIDLKGASPDSADTDKTFTPQGSFSSPGGILAVPFGATHTVGEQTTALPFELYISIGDVAALSLGRVKEIGTHAVLGQYVIIDHGCGIYSWYCGLSQVYLAVGDIVAAGDRLGKAGSTLSANGEQTLLLMTTVGKTAIDPAFLRNDPPRFEGN